MKQLLALFIILNVTTSSYSQFVIQGQVTEQNGDPMPFATVYLQKSKFGTVADDDGNYMLQLNDPSYSSDYLQVSFIGFETTKKLVDLTQNSTVNVVLKSAAVPISEVVVKSSKKELTALKIVKKATANIKKNYVISPHTTDGFYRETIAENDKHIRLNEAAIRFNFSKYPGKNAFKGGFKKYWDIYYDYYRSLHKSCGGVSAHAQFYPYYNSKYDQAKILGSRFSDQLGEYKLSVNPCGGPLDLTGNDKLKYLYDFFDPARYKDYAYKKSGIVMHEGEICYLIQFWPTNKTVKRRFYHTYNNKMESAVYSGQMIISVDDFSVFRIECERTDLEYIVKRNRMKNYNIDKMALLLEYHRTNKGMKLEHVLNSEQILWTYNNTPFQFEIIRELWISDSLINLNREEYDWQERLDLTTNSTIEDFTEKYDAEFWKSFEKSSLYPPLSEEVVTDLETHTTLEQQYRSQFVPIEEIPVPNSNKEDDALILHGDTLVDNYRWLETKSTATMDYISQENRYYDQVMNQVKKYRREFVGIVGNMFVVDSLKAKQSPKPFGHYELITKSIDDSFKLFVVEADSTKRTLFNFTSVEAPKRIWEWKLSDSLTHIGYWFDTEFGLAKTLVIKNTDSGLTDTIKHVVDFSWLNDSILVYSSSDLTAKYPANEVHWFNCFTKNDSLIYRENDGEHELEINKSSSGELIFVRSVTKIRSKQFFINQDLNFVEVKVLENDIIISIDHKAGDQLLCVADYNRLHSFPIDPGVINEENLIFQFKEDQTILEAKETQNYFLISVYEVGKVKLYSLDKRTKNLRQIRFDGDFYHLEIEMTDYMNDSCVIYYEAPMVPGLEYRLSVASGQKVVKRAGYRQLKSGYKPEYFATKQIFAKAPDGEKIPITYFKRKYSKMYKGTILKVYGAYGATHTRGFSENDLALANLGFIVAYAHVRGGMEYGQDWYFKGKNLNKRNSITDYIACAKHLISSNLATDSTLIGYGLSAGGTVTAAAMNMEPSLFNTVILDRPFVDVLTSQSIDTLALTTCEYSEIGNPNIKEDYNYIKSYCPYQNIEKKSYPNIVYFSRLNDVNVPYWNAVKHIAKIREKNSFESKQIIQLSKGGHMIPYSKSTTDFADIYGFVMHFLVEIK